MPTWETDFFYIKAYFSSNNYTITDRSTLTWSGSTCSSQIDKIDLLQIFNIP